MDAFGCGAFAPHSLLDGQTSVNMRSATAPLQDNNPSLMKVRVLVVDKGYTEVAFLQECFPSATVTVCQFHVIDYLNREISKRKYQLNDVQAKHMKSILRLLVYALDESEFNQLLDAQR